MDQEWTWRVNSEVSRLANIIEGSHAWRWFWISSPKVVLNGRELPHSKSIGKSVTLWLEHGELQWQITNYLSMKVLYYSVAVILPHSHHVRLELPKPTWTIAQDEPVERVCPRPPYSWTEALPDPKWELLHPSAWFTTVSLQNLMAMPPTNPRTLCVSVEPSWSPQLAYCSLDDTFSGIPWDWSLDRGSPPVRYTSARSGRLHVITRIWPSFFPHVCLCLPLLDFRNGYQLFDLHNLTSDLRADFVEDRLHAPS